MKRQNVDLSAAKMLANSARHMELSCRQYAYYGIAPTVVYRDSQQAWALSAIHMLMGVLA